MVYGFHAAYLAGCQHKRIAAAQFRCARCALGSMPTRLTEDAHHALRVCLGSGCVPHRRT